MHVVFIVGMPVVVTVGGVSSPATVTVAVQGAS